MVKSARRTVSLAIGLSISWSVMTHACEPAAFDFDVFLKHNDLNHDGFLQIDELLNADYNKHLIEKDISTLEAFNQLDTNHDRQLSSEELWAWGEYVHNACAGWPWSS